MVLDGKGEPNDPGNLVHGGVGHGDEPVLGVQDRVHEANSRWATGVFEHARFSCCTRFCQLHRRRGRGGRAARTLSPNLVARNVLCGVRPRGRRLEIMRWPIATLPGQPRQLYPSPHPNVGRLAKCPLLLRGQLLGSLLRLSDDHPGAHEAPYTRGHNGDTRVSRRRRGDVSRHLQGVWR